MPADNALAEFVNTEPPERITALISALRDGSVTTGASRAAVEYALVLGPKTGDRVMAVLKEWREIAGDGSEVALTHALVAGTTVRTAVENRGPRCELVWTGPPGPPGVRTTDQVIEEMLGHASRGVVVVQYAVHITGGSLRVLEGMAVLARKGVRATVLVDGRWKDGLSIKQLKKHWPTDAPRPAIWSYVEEEDEIAKLHAKVLIVDRRDMLVTSANLTGYGLGTNLEFGVRVQGAPALHAADHFDALTKSGALEKIKW